MTPPPSGEQFRISLGDQRATIVEVGGGIREYSVAGRDVLVQYPVSAMCDGAHGSPLIPWPNRLADGRYRFGDHDHQLALTEPAKGNAIHGLLMWRPWTPLDHSESSVTVGATIHPMPGYPFELELRITYALGQSGLTVTTHATNNGSAPCPFGAGQHPYLSPGNGLIDDCTLRLKASTRIVTDPLRQLPLGSEPVAGTEFDFTSPRILGQTQIDHAFADLGRDAQRRVWVHLSGTDGRTASLWGGDRYRYLQLYTGDGLAPERRRTGLGAEPMTCPPNAFQTGESLTVLQPSESVTLQWGASLS